VLRRRALIHKEIMRIIIVIAAVLLAAACSSGGSKPAGQLPPTNAPAAAQNNSVGSTITVKTKSGPVDVTPVQIVDPATPANPNMSVTSGRWVAVQFRFVNKGPAQVLDNFYGLSASDAQGQQIRIQANADVAAGPSIEVLSGLHLGPSDTLLGYITFEVPDGAKLARIQYTPQGGTMAEWKLG
jgi:uncharacterized lipoprotein YajG